MSTRARLGGIRDRMVNRMLGIDLRARAIAIEDFIARDDARQLEVAEDLVFIKRRLSAELQLIRERHDQVDVLRSQLEQVRQGIEYESAFADPEPLVSVRIHSFEKTEQLIDVALASVFRQSYERFEVVIVNDGPNPRTRRAIEGLHDARIRFSELPTRGNYPEDIRSRWMVAGTPAANEAIDQAQGVWIAPLDDDDEFSADHIEKLLSVARAESAELAHGAVIQKNLVNGTEERIWSSPPAISQFSFQGALYLRLLSFFKYDAHSWMLDEPADWNLVRRMNEAGVRMTSIADTVAIMNMVPYTHKPAPGDGSAL